MDEHELAQYQQSIDQIDHMVDSSAHRWREYLDQARTAMSGLDALSFFDDPSQLDTQIRTLNVLQNLAYHDVDSGSVTDIADWVLQKWLQLLQDHPQNVEILKSIGLWWLNKAQPSLARVHSLDGSSSSGSGGRPRSRAVSEQLSLTPSEEERLAAASLVEAESRLHTSDYVEARGILLPAVEYLRQAVDEASSRGRPRGSLLVAAAEAYMSLGNVSYTRVNEDYFRQAVHYLRRASSTPGYPLPAHLQRYLDDYGRFVD